MLQALYNYMVALQVEQKLFEKEKELLAVGEQAKSKEYGQLYRVVMDLFDKCVQVLGDECVSIQELSEILDAGFEAANLAVIQPGYDSVTIGDIELTRYDIVLGKLLALVFNIRDRGTLGDCLILCKGNIFDLCFGNHGSFGRIIDNDTGLASSSTKTL